MHYHLEILMPPTDDVPAMVAKALAEFDECNPENRYAFFDWYVIGGRWSGTKLQQRIGEERLSAFQNKLHSMGVTVSSFRAGKPRLSPESQEGTVNALWREMCPGNGDVCPLFKNEVSFNLDACRLDELPSGLKCEAFLYVSVDDDDEVEPKLLLRGSIFNGVNSQDTTWDGSVEKAFELLCKRIGNYRDEYRKAIEPRPDWLLVTVDYHS